MRMDFEVGDFVKVKPNANNFVGSVGKVIGSRFNAADNYLGGIILYTVKFNDRQSADYDARKLWMVRKKEDEQI